MWRRNVKSRSWIVVLFVSCLTGLRVGHVSSVVVTVERRQQDVFTNPPHRESCYNRPVLDFCTHLVATGGYDPNFNNTCTCICARSASTFFVKRSGGFSCVSNSELRNITLFESPPWVYLLASSSSAGSPIQVLNIHLSPKDVIEFKINGNIKMIKSCNPYQAEITEDSFQWSSINQMFNSMSADLVKPKEYNTHFNLTIDWKDTSGNFSGKLMRIRIRCSTATTHGSKSLEVDNFIVFKVTGTFQVEFPSSSSSAIPQPLSETTAMSPTIAMSPTAAISSKDSQQITTSRSTSTSSTGATVSQTQPVIITLSHQATTSAVEPSPGVVSTAIVQSTSNVFQSSPVIKSSTTSLSLKLTVSIPFIQVSSSSNMNATSMPGKQSDSGSVTKAITGAVVGVLIVLIIVIVILYILRKRKRKQMSESNGAVKQNPKNVGLQEIPTLCNPVHEDGAYENPQDVDKNRLSGIKSIQSAMYDQCIVVENPSATRQGSVYDNVNNKVQSNHTYQELDPKKREPPSKYQSLVRPTNEYASVRSIDPVYSVANDDRPAQTSEPVYNVLEPGGLETNSVDGPVEMKAEPDYAVLEQSYENGSEMVGKREPVYSVVEDE